MSGAAARVAAQQRRRPGQTTHVPRFACFLDSGLVGRIRSAASGQLTPAWLPCLKQSSVKPPSIRSCDDLTAQDLRHFPAGPRGEPSHNAVVVGHDAAADHHVPASERPVFRTAKRADSISGT